MTSNQPTTQSHSDDHFEEHLRGFRPVAPRKLAVSPRRAPWAAVAVAAGVLLAAGISFVTRHDPQPTVRHSLAQPVTMGRLNAALRDNDETFSSFLDDASPNILPRGRNGTVLYELGKE